ncbi:HEPN domain-containing protein [Fulvivirga ligni]|uniref:HEPN domain-containing protein n=1 Tax=Fulvivirga ligni TaxID=2904246 RepID=UPI001F3ACF5C|nr:HEPN domain-containing protein [Fulvivirga ligni]UII21570.1 HEPN domain-containing protein [Fulvivirga ligni]UII21624.1 HEPN domain-containing protein [Fulvivirga ligni]
MKTMEINSLGQCSYQQLINVIREVVKPDMIYLLGSSQREIKSESIFISNPTTVNYTSEYYLLIVIPELNDKNTYEWEEIIECRCKSIIPIICIVLQTSIFEKWLKAGHSFAVKVFQSADIIHSSQRSLFDDVTLGEITDQKEIKDFYNTGINKAKEFLKTAELCRLSDQNALAMFMLHQSAEQALTALIKAGTGYHRRTHNLSRLIRLSGLVTNEVRSIFPQHTEEDKRLLKLLQSAYSDGRYKREYRVRMDDLLLCIRHVSVVLEICCERANIELIHL